MSKPLIKAVTKQQLADIVQSYQQFFPDWQIIAGERLVRRSGPIMQQMGFEALRSGNYRPSGGVRVLIAPGTAVLHTFLNVRYREILPAQHAAKVNFVVKAIENEFKPSVRAPLDYAVVLRLCEERVMAGFNDFCALAALNAYAENYERALHYIGSIRTLVSSLGRPMADWEGRYFGYACDLEKSITSGHAGEFLNSFL